MITATQYEWENKIDGNQTTNQTSTYKYLQVLTSTYKYLQVLTTSSYSDFREAHLDPSKNKGFFEHMFILCVPILQQIQIIFFCLRAGASRS